MNIALTKLNLNDIGVSNQDSLNFGSAKYSVGSSWKTTEIESIPQALVKYLVHISFRLTGSQRAKSVMEIDGCSGILELFQSSK